MRYCAGSERHTAGYGRWRYWWDGTRYSRSASGVVLPESTGEYPGEYSTSREGGSEQVRSGANVMRPSAFKCFQPSSSFSFFSSIKTEFAGNDRGFLTETDPAERLPCPATAAVAWSKASNAVSGHEEKGAVNGNAISVARKKATA